jgi:hypothetical protein
MRAETETHRTGPCATSAARAAIDCCWVGDGLGTHATSATWMASCGLRAPPMQLCCDAVDAPMTGAVY